MTRLPNWSPYAAAVLAFAAGMWQKWPCHSAGWPYDRELIFGRLCYSDFPVLYEGRGLAQGHFPYSTERSFEYPVLTGYLADITARLSGTPAAYYLLNAFVMLACTLVTVWATVRLTGRTGAGLIVGLSPVLAVTGTINWDMLPVMFTMLALLLFKRDQQWLAGVAIGLGTAAKLYPALLLLAFLVASRRRGSSRLGPPPAAGERKAHWPPLALASRPVIAAGLTWVVVNLPVVVLFPDGWLEFFRLNQSRPADFGSVYYALELLGIKTPSLNVLAMVALGLCVLAILLWAPRDPVVLSFLLVAAFLVTNKVYSPQYVLWLLPLAVAAGAPLLSLVLWQAGELAYWWSVWKHLHGSITYDGYAFFVFARVAVTLVLCASVVIAFRHERVLARSS
ncbi:glycosyltransferase 87 family protein [Allorhizocola rhizosphaerae]|uniref:glycosyltransferase 87 family protein n=1 Tax=Allorhizocola rhizosphaerae TaxID=1872709 RepID=UPI000E3CE92A|nr:glycosyltransferase 87 family protein [Allorhizocola rhizosphaerae]